MSLKTATLVSCILALCLAGVVFADGVPAEDADLNAAGYVYEVHPDAAGNLVVTDHAAGEVWRVTAATGAYTRYSGLSGASDARADSAGDIWWTDYGAVLGRINVGAGTITTWDFNTWELNPNYNLSGLAFDSAGRIWISEYSGSSPRLYRFDPETAELCPYEMPDGAASAYLVQLDDQLWLINGVTNRLVRFDPSSNRIAWWQLPAGGAMGLLLDAAEDLWIAGAEGDSILRYRPGDDEFTSFALPVAAAPLMLAVDGRFIWYSAGDTVGRLDPAQVGGEPYTSESGSEPVTALDCVTLGAGAPVAMTRSRGTLAWTAAAWTPLENAAGWQIYGLPPAGSGWGIAAASGRIWAGDQGRQKLVRAALGTTLAAPVVSISVDGDGVELAWEAVEGATGYQVWRDASPYFEPGGAPLDTVSASPWPDEGVLNGEPNYFYLVRAAAPNVASDPSNRTGEFTFDLVGGQ